MIRDTDRALIRGRRRPSGARVHVDAEPLAPATQFWEASLCLRNHSPAEPEWGYAGCGAAQLALTVLLLVTDSVEAERHYQVFQAIRHRRHPGRSLDPPGHGRHVVRFLEWCDARGLELRQVSPGDAARFIEELAPSPRFASSSTSW